MDSVTGVIADIGAKLACVFTICMFLIVLFDVVYRTLFHASIVSAVELGGYALAFLSFYGMTWTYRQDGFIRVDLLYGKIRGVMKKIIDAVLHAILAAYFIFVVKYFWDFVVYSYNRNLISLDVMATPLWIPRLVIAIGATLFVIVAIWDFIRSIIVIFQKDIGDVPA